jgi:hypothetical protein
MRAHGNIVARQVLHDFDLQAAALELDDAGALLHQPDRIGECLILRGIAHEGQIAHQKRPLQPARHGPRVIDHVIHRDRHRSVVTLDHHAERIPGQHDVDAGIIDQLREACVIGRKAGDALPLLTHLGQG